MINLDNIYQKIKSSIGSNLLFIYYNYIPKDFNYSYSENNYSENEKWTKHFYKKSKILNEFNNIFFNKKKNKENQIVIKTFYLKTKLNNELKLYFCSETYTKSIIKNDSQSDSESWDFI